MDEGKQARANEVIARVERERGVVRNWPRRLAQHDPEHMERLHELTAHVLLRTPHLPRKVKELMLVALDAHDFYESGVRLHARGALDAGATREELLEALQVVSIVNMHALTSMIEAVHEEADAFAARAAAGASQ